MAKPFDIRVVVRAEDRSQAIDRVTKRLDGLQAEIVDTSSEFKKGEKSADQYGKSIDKVDKEVKQLDTSLEQSEGRLGRFSRSFSKFGATIRSRALAITAAVAALAGAFRTLESAANLEGQQRALELSLQQQGESLDAFLNKLKEVSRGTIAESDLIAASSRALLLGIPAREIADLLEIARASAIATGQSVSAAFNDITTGIGRASPLILDNLGLMVNLTETYGNAAREVGKSAEQLTQAERSQALLNAVLDIGRQRVALYGEAQSLTTESIQRGKAALDDFKNVLGGAFGRVLTGAAATLTLFAGAVSETARGVLFLAEQFAALLNQIPGFTGAFTKMESGIKSVREALLEFSNDSAELGVRLAAATIATDDAARGIGGVASASDDAAARLRALGGELNLSESGFSTLERSTDGSTESLKSFEDQVSEADARLEALRARLAGVREETEAVNAELQRFSANAIPAIGGDRSTFATVGGGQFTTFSRLPGTTPDGRVIVPGVGRPIANPNFVG